MVSNGDRTSSLTTFLEKFAGGRQNFDNLRLPLQTALLISPIFLLQDAQIHLSSFYVQRYKLALVRVRQFDIMNACSSSNLPKQYSKALGNERPDIISQIEDTIWGELFRVARGLQTVREAASKIVANIPHDFDSVEAEMRSWFKLSMRFYSLPSDNRLITQL